MRLALAALVLGFCTTAAHAEGYASFNASSFARAAVLPALGGSTVLEDGTRETRVTLDWANEYVTQTRGTEELTLDIESQRLAFAHRRGFGTDWEWGVELPLVFTGGGLLDSLIENWHDTFSLPNGGRERAPQDRTLVEYRRDGRTLLQLTEGDSGLGDARLLLGRRWGESGVLRAQLQLPTGQAKTLAGGGTGLALWAGQTGDWGVARYQISAGLSANRRSGVLSQHAKTVVAFGGASLTAALLEHWDGVLQVQANSAVNSDTQLDAFSAAGVQLAFGLRRRFDGGQLDIAVQEDLSVGASPDFALHLAMVWRP